MTPIETDEETQKAKDAAEALLNADNLKGIAFMAGGMFLFSAADMLAKLLTENFHPLQIAWTRQSGLFCVSLYFILRIGPSIFKTEHLPLQISRGTVAAISATLFILAIKFVPLADAVAVGFVAPLMVTLLGAILLREYVGPRRWAAIAIGLLGTVIVIRPGLGVFHPAMFLVLLGALMYAMRQVISRKLSLTDPFKTTVVYTACVAMLILTLPLALVWRMPHTGYEFMLMASMAGLGAMAELFVIRALTLAQAVVLAPVHYTLLIWGTFYGWLVFDQLPDGWTGLGAFVILASGLYTLHRERQLKLAAKKQRRAL